MRAESCSTARTAREAMLLFNNIYDTVAPTFEYERKRIMTSNPFREFKASVGHEWNREQKRKKGIITVDYLGKAVATLEFLWPPDQIPEIRPGQLGNWLGGELRGLTPIRLGLLPSAEHSPSNYDFLGKQLRSSAVPDQPAWSNMTCRNPIRVGRLTFCFVDNDL